MKRPAFLIDVTDRLGRPGIWMLIVLLPLWSLPLWFLGSLGPKERAAVLELTLWAFVAWPMGIVLLPEAWCGGPKERVLASAGRGMARVAIMALLLGPLVTLFAMALAYGNFEYYWDHALGSFLLLLIIGSTLARRIAKGELRSKELIAARRHLDHLEWMERREPFSPGLLTRLLDALAEQALLDSGKAEAGLMTLASLYKEWLRRGEEPLITLRGERELGERLAALMEGCLPGIPNLHWEWDSSLDAMRIPSLFLQPLLESALSTNAAGTVKVQCRSMGGNAEMRITHPGSSGTIPMVDASSLQRRLQSCLGSGARFETYVRGGVWTAVCLLPGGLR
jgi:hypothetical protein